MILVCESCNARYLLSPDALTSDGSKVRCMKCKHEWFQKPEAEPQEELPEEEVEIVEEAASEEEIELEPIPEGVKPVGDDSFALAIPSEEGGRAGFSIGTAVSGIAAVFVFLIIFGIFVGMHTSVVNAWPATALLYDKVGINTVVDGEGLIFDHVRVVSKRNRAGEDILYIEGDIINLREEAVSIPVINADLHLSDGSSFDEIVITPPANSIEPDTALSFSTTYRGADKDIKEVKLMFILGDSTSKPVHAELDTDHKKLEEDHGPASSHH